MVGSAWGQGSASVEEILQALRAGGHVIVFRHGATHPDQADTDPLNLENVAKQRHLNDKGHAQAKALRALVATMPDPGTNTLIVTHKPNVLDAFGKDWFEVKEGEASVFRPDASGKYSLVGRVQIDQWETTKK
jgi:broad specificity phosphatase PhoE